MASNKVSEHPGGGWMDGWMESLNNKWRLQLHLADDFYWCRPTFEQRGAANGWPQQFRHATAQRHRDTIKARAGRGMATHNDDTDVCVYVCAVLSVCDGNNAHDKSGA